MRSQTGAVVRFLEIWKGPMSAREERTWRAVAGIVIIAALAMALVG
jgi:hypothetical protein